MSQVHFGPFQRVRNSVRRFTATSRLLSVPLL